MCEANDSQSNLLHLEFLYRNTDIILTTEVPDTTMEQALSVTDPLTMNPLTNNIVDLL